ncbi:hypothetical protein BGZ76_000591 [Entomortierella beljakovae]|nr:hypothetical protein BGZ76_000591 [Entomortierella beljakovae]
MQSSNSYSSSQEDYESRRSISSSWGRPSEYSNYSEDNLTTTSGSIAMTVEEKIRQRMRRKWAKFSQTQKDKATRQWLAYWSIYGTVQVVDTWSSFLLDWIPGYNLGKLLFLWWAQRRGATLVFDYFQPLIQSKNKDGREVARKPSNRSLNSEMSRDRDGPSGNDGPSSGSRPRSIQMLPSTLAHQQQQQHQQYQQQHQQYQQEQFEHQFYAKGSSSRRDTAAFRDLNQGRRRRDDYYEDDEDGEEYHSLQQQQQYILQQQQQQRKSTQPMDLRRELMTSSPHDSGSFAEPSLFESAESVWSAPPSSSNVLAVENDVLGAGAFSNVASLHSNNATPTPMSVQEQFHLRQQLLQQQQSSQKPQALASDTESYIVSSANHWNPSTTVATSTD